MRRTFKYRVNYIDQSYTIIQLEHTTLARVDAIIRLLCLDSSVKSVERISPGEI